MPNWNSNWVKIHAPVSEVKKYLVYNKKAKKAMFNMHLLYPSVFEFSDPEGLKSWDYHWAIENTGSKWFPHIEEIGEASEDETLLIYQSPWSPNNGLLKRLHEATGWRIKNEYEEPGWGFEWTFMCNGGYFSDDVRVFHPLCEVCETKTHPDEIVSEDGCIICYACHEALSNDQG